MPVFLDLRTLCVARLTDQMVSDVLTVTGSVLSA